MPAAPNIVPAPNQVAIIVGTHNHRGSFRPATIKSSWDPAVALVLAIIGWIGGLMVAFGYVFQTMTGVPMEIGILAGGVIVIAYTAIGGMWAVAVTDFVQVVIIAIGLLVLLVVVLIDVGGWGVIAPQLPKHTFRLIPLEHGVEIWL